MRQSPDRGLDWVHFPAEVGDLLIILLCTTIYSFTHFVNLSSKAAVLYTEEPAGPAIGKHRVNKTSNANQTFWTLSARETVWKIVPYCMGLEAEMAIAASHDCLWITQVIKRRRLQPTSISNAWDWLDWTVVTTLANDVINVSSQIAVALWVAPACALECTAEALAS